MTTFNTPSLAPMGYSKNTVVAVCGVFGMKVFPQKGGVRWRSLHA